MDLFGLIVLRHGGDGGGSCEGQAETGKCYVNNGGGEDGYIAD